jgi:hypothetical protein
MDQSLLDSSKYKIYSMSVDSRFADQYNGGDTADYTIRLPSTYRNIARIALSSVELPLVEYLFSECHGNLSIQVDSSGAVSPGYQPVEIPPGNYKPCDLILTLKAALQAVDPSFNVLILNTTGTLCLTAPHAFTINPVSTDTVIAARPNYWGLGYYLGFRSKGPLTATYDAELGLWTLCGTAVVLTQPTPYYLLQLWSPDFLENVTHRVAGVASVPAFAKLVLRDGFYVIQFVDGGDYMRKEFTFLAPANVSQLRLKLLDPFGAPVDLRGMDWSATFELYEVVNTRTYNTMARTYGRD